MERVITIVSGLPRSGTSMMMGMLKAGGMEVLVDNIRMADADNPKGYFEFERVKKIKEDTSWLEGAEEKAFKMVSMLLKHLPPEKRYKIIFMKRTIEEILASQRRMLERFGRDNSGISDKEMGELFAKHLKRTERLLESQDNIDVQYIIYNDIIRKPLENALTLNRFLGNRLDVDEMVKVVDISLYRQRI
jgi:hypothetical protein